MTKAEAKKELTLMEAEQRANADQVAESQKRNVEARINGGDKVSNLEEPKSGVTARKVSATIDSGMTLQVDVYDAMFGDQVQRCFTKPEVETWIATRRSDWRERNKSRSERLALKAMVAVTAERVEKAHSKYSEFVSMEIVDELRVAQEALGNVWKKIDTLGNLK